VIDVVAGVPRQLFLPVHPVVRSSLAALVCCIGPVAREVKLQDDGVVRDPVDGCGGGQGIGEDGRADRIAMVECPHLGSDRLRRGLVDRDRDMECAMLSGATPFSSRSDHAPVAVYQVLEGRILWPSSRSPTFHHGKLTRFKATKVRVDPALSSSLLDGLRHNYARTITGRANP